ncbi:cysteine desulfurase DndA [Mycolicibacterium litorale]|uniref:cysteine desulfurase DndA n=1 Tax=Mycolicibacterium litorale TaxID=758802 RepID=UPI003CF95E01
MTVTTATDTPESYPQDASQRPIYLDCNATTPMDPRVAAEVAEWMVSEFGNAGSRTHAYGQAAKERVARARREVASVVDARPEDVSFTSGATESNNLAILGLAEYGESVGKRHLICSQIEHKAVLEPFGHLQTRGFEVTTIAPSAGGWVDANAVAEALRPDTLLVSVMAVNNETGVTQPIEAIASELSESEAFFHVDAAQGFGKLIDPLLHKRIDLISVSGHKIYGPKGIGALVMRRRAYKRPPIKPLMFGGGQERGLRPGTLPVGLIAGLGLASDLALREHSDRHEHCKNLQHAALRAFMPLGAVLNGDLERTVSHTLNISMPGVDAEAAIVALKEIAALSNGSACTSQSYEPSHVLTAAGLPASQISGALRFSWSYMTREVEWSQIASRLTALTQTG